MSYPVRFLLNLQNVTPRRLEQADVRATRGDFNRIPISVLRCHDRSLDETLAQTTEYINFVTVAAGGFWRPQLAQLEVSESSPDVKSNKCHCICFLPNML